MTEKTLAIIKPDSVEKRVIGEIIRKIEEAGFNILAIKFTKLTEKQARSFYEVHKERHFYLDLVKYMTSGPIVAIALEKDNAVEEFRKLIGNTDPTKAEPGTIRKLFGTNIEKNAIHGSDSAENAEKEILFFFTKSELV